MSLVFRSFLKNGLNVIEKSSKSDALPRKYRNIQRWNIRDFKCFVLLNGRAELMKKDFNNCVALQRVSKESPEGFLGLKRIARIIGVKIQMKAFNYPLGIIVLRLIY